MIETKLFWKSVIRRKGSLLLLLALIVASTFGFTLRTVEYLAVSQEIARISREYRPIGELSAPDQVVSEGVPLIAENPYVELVDVRRACPAILSDVYNADLDGDRSGYRENGIGIGELMVWGKLGKEIKTDQPGIRNFDFRIEKGVYGYPEYIEAGKKLRLELTVPGEGSQMEIPEEGKTCLIRGYLPTEDNLYGYEGQLNIRLLELEEGICFLEGEPDEETAQRYIDAEAVLQERNRHAMMAVGTADMTAMPLVQEASRDFYLEDGRWLNSKDQEEGNRVCVVAKEFADVRGIAVGDTLTMTFQDRIPTVWGYASLSEDTWEECDKIEEVLEVVGIYGRLYGGMAGGPGWAVLSSRSNCIYVPDSCIPGHFVEDGGIDQSSFSFVLSDPREKDAFLQEMEGELASLGLSVTFMESSWDNFYQSAEAVTQGGFYSLVIFTALLALTLLAVVFLYAWQRRKETAVARALGVPAKRAALNACLPLTALSVPAILAGGLPAWSYGQAQAEKTLAALEVEGRTGLPWPYPAGLCLLVWLLLSLALLSGNLFHARKPVLEVLQGGNARRPKGAEDGTYRSAAGNQKAGAETVWASAAGTERLDMAGMSVKGTGTSSRNQEPGEGEGLAGPAREAVTLSGRRFLAAMARFMGHHLCRFSLRSLFALLAAAGFLLASCWLRYAIRSGEAEAERLYRSTTVEAEVTKKNASMLVSGHGGAYIGERTIQRILETGAVREYLLVAGSEGSLGMGEDIKLGKVSFIGIGDVGQCLPQIGNGLQIRYGDAYGPELFENDYTAINYYGGLENMPVIILPEGLAAELEVEAGDLLFAYNGEGTIAADAEVGGVYAGEVNGAGGNVILAPLSFLKLLEEENLYYTTARFTLDPEQNRKLSLFEEEVWEIIEGPEAGLQELSLVVWDGELRRVVEPMEKNITLMKVLYPLTNAVSLLAAAGLSILFLFQRRREAAILRVLGVGVLSTRTVLVLELLVLDVVGLLLGAALVALMTGTNGLAAMPLAAGCCFLGCLIGALAGAVLVTRGRPLVLLQEKE